MQLIAAADDPDVAAVLERSTAERLALLRRIFVQLGASDAVAEDRALATYSHFLGLAQLRAQDPGLLAAPARMRAHLRELEAALLAGIALAAPRRGDRPAPRGPAGCRAPETRRAVQPMRLTSSLATGARPQP